MNFVVVGAYDNYVPAHMALGRLKEDGFHCWLKDENTVTIDPLLSNAVGGIKLMVEESEAKRAWELLNQLQIGDEKQVSCPRCGSLDIEIIIKPRKTAGWLSIILDHIRGLPASDTGIVYRCRNCEKEFNETDEN